MYQTEDYIEPSGKHIAMWHCICYCNEHNEVDIVGKDLKRKNGTKSCGCIQKEKLAKYNSEYKKKYNKYDLSGEYGIGWTSNTNNEFYFDLEDYDLIKNYCWEEDAHKEGYHSLRSWDCGVQKVIKFHHLINCKNYDHINRNPLDNRKCNLRPATSSQNQMNKGKQRNNTSGITGVGWMKDCEKWRARISLNKKEKNLGCYINKEDAIRARLIAEKDFFGEFAPQQYLFKQYGV